MRSVFWRENNTEEKNHLKFLTEPFGKNITSPLWGGGGNNLKIRNFPSRVPNLVHNICCFGIKVLLLQKNTGLCQF